MLKHVWVVKKQIMEERINVEEVYTQGSSLLARMFSAIYLGDFVSYYLALWNRVDPSPVEVIEAMKKASTELSEELSKIGEEMMKSAEGAKAESTPENTGSTEEKVHDAEYKEGEEK